MFYALLKIIMPSITCMTTENKKLLNKLFVFVLIVLLHFFLTHGSKFDCCTFVLFAADERSNQRVRTYNFGETHLMLTFTVVRTMYTHVIIL